MDGPWRSRLRRSAFVPALVLLGSSKFLSIGFVGPNVPSYTRSEGRPVARRSEGGDLLEGERFIVMNRFRVKEGAEERFEQRWGKDRSVAGLEGLRWFSLLRRVSSTPKSTGALSVVFNYDDEQFEDDYTYVSLGVWESKGAFSASTAQTQEDSASFASAVLKGFPTSGPPKPALWDGMLLEKAEETAKAAPFIVMNRFTVKPGSEPEFEQRWAKRESKLQEAKGFQFFQLLRRAQTPDDDVNYISMSAWTDRSSFDTWWSSKSFANMAQVQGNLLESEIVRYFYEGVFVVEGDKGL